MVLKSDGMKVTNVTFNKRFTQTRYKVVEWVWKMAGWSSLTWSEWAWLDPGAAHLLTLSNQYAQVREVDRISYMATRSAIFM